VILNLAEDAIKNLLIQSQPAELKSGQSQNASSQNPESDPLTANFLAKALDSDAQDPLLSEDLLPSLLDQDFVSNIVQQTQRVIAAQPKISAQIQTAQVVVPVVAVTEIKSGLDVPTDIGVGDDAAEEKKETAKKMQSQDTDNNQAQIFRDGVAESKIILIQNQIEIVNTLNHGGNTVITIRQR
jgi:hypothetical protein